MSIKNKIYMSLFCSSFLLGALCVSAEEPAASPSPNLLVNGTFEKDADGDGIPDGWSKWPATTKLTIDKSTDRTAAMIEVGADEAMDWQRIEQEINVEPDATYTISVEIKTENVTAEGTAGTYIAGSIIVDDQIIEGVGWNKETWLFNAQPTQDWKCHTYTFNTKSAPKGAKFRIGAIVHGRGKAWFANMRLDKGKSPAK